MTRPWKIIALSALSIAASASANDDPIAKIGGWGLYENDEDCAVLAQYDGSTFFRVGFAPIHDTAFVSVADPSFKSIEADKEYTLRVMLIMPGNRQDDGWGEVKTTGFRLKNLEGVGDINGVRMSFNGVQFIDDLAKANLIAFFRGDTIVSSLSLKDSAAAMQRLKTCSWRVAKRNPPDPFKD